MADLYVPGTAANSHWWMKVRKERNGHVTISQDHGPYGLVNVLLSGKQARELAEFLRDGGR